MRVIDPGHWYELDHLDHQDHVELGRLRFVKRIGDKFPGNEPPAYEGTTIQEVLRACLDRLAYVDAQESHSANINAIFHLREAILHLEQRAAARRGDAFSMNTARSLVMVEKLPTCKRCGHIGCKGNHK